MPDQWEVLAIERETRFGTAKALETICPGLMNSVL